MTLILEHGTLIWKEFNLQSQSPPAQKASDDPMIKPPKTVLTWGIMGEIIEQYDTEGNSLGQGIGIVVDENQKPLAVLYAKTIEEEKPRVKPVRPAYERVEAKQKQNLSRQHSRQAHVRLSSSRHR